MSQTVELSRQNTGISASRWLTLLTGLLEIVAILGVCYVFAGSPTPAVNEAHYLAKAKHYWQPEWCAGDFFCESADAHEVFYWTFGWVTQHLSLPATAWTGRLLVWTLFAIAWCRLLRSLTNMPLAGLLSAFILLPLTHYGHLAGEWLIGGIEAKGFAYPLVLLAFARVVEGKWWQVWPLLGLASSFHILVGGWAVVACLFAWIVRRKEDELSIQELATWLVLGGTLALPGLIPALQLTADATAEQVREANITYTFRRLSHHLVPYRFAQWNPFAPKFTIMRPLCFGLVCWLWWKFAQSASGPRWQRLQAIVNGSLVIAACGLLVEVLLSPFDHFQIPPFNNMRASLLRFYWFRMSDMMLPIGLSIVCVLPLRQSKAPFRTAFLAVCLAAVGIFAASQQYGCFARSMSIQQQNWSHMLPNAKIERVDEDWLDACSWIRENVDAESKSVTLTPVRQQTFKWYAQRPDVVTWKDVPQDAPGIVAWWNRRRAVYKLGDWPWNEPEQLANLLQSYGVTHIVWPDQASRPHGLEAKQVYRNELFRIFTIDRTQVAPLSDGPPTPP